MFKVTIEGNTLGDLKENICIIYNELMFDHSDVPTVSKEIKATLPSLYFDKVNEKVELPTRSIQEERLLSLSIDKELHPPVTEGTKQNPEAKDSRGVKWDGRIHNAKQRTNKLGEWIYVRGVDDALVNQIENNVQEIKVTVPPVPNVSSDMPVSSSFPTTTQVEPVALTVTLPPAPPIVQPAPIPILAQPVATVPPPNPAQIMPPTLKGFDAFKLNVVNVMSELINSGKITTQYIDDLKKYFKVTEIWETFKNEQQLKEIYDSFIHYGFLKAE